MTLATHIITGALIGIKIKNPFYIVVVSVAVHFFLDILPHGDYVNKKSTLREWWKNALDFSLGIAIILLVFLFRGLPEGATISNITLAIIFSLLPDFTHFLYRYLNMSFLRPIKNFHEGLHYYPNTSPEREFRLKNNLWDIFISFVSFLILILA